MLAALVVAWNAHPKERLGQLIFNAQNQPVHHHDTFYVSDCDLRASLERYARMSDSECVEMMARDDGGQRPRPTEALRYRWIVRIEGASGLLSGYATVASTSTADPALAMQNALQRLDGVGPAWRESLAYVSVERRR